MKTQPQVAAPSLAQRYFVRRPGAIPELDGLRAIAIALVLARHSMGVFYNRTGEFFAIGGWDLAVPLTNGWMGVDLFFVLSGFLIGHHLIRRAERSSAPDESGMPPKGTSTSQRADSGLVGMTIRRYLLKRLLRIVPAYYAFMLVVAAGWIPHYQPGEGVWRSVGYHLLFLQDYLPSDIVVAFWSLGVEEKFYLLAPLVVLGAVRLERRRRYAVLGALALAPMLLRAAAWVGSGPLEYGEYFEQFRSPFHFTFEGLVIGTIIAHLYHDAEAQKWLSAQAGRRIHVLGWLIVGLHLVAVPLFDTISTYDVVFLETVLAFGFGCIVLGVVVLAREGEGIPALRSHWLLVLSVLSYSLYLTHMVFMYSSFGVLDARLGIGTWPSMMQYAAYLPVFLGLSVASALVLHFGVERPGLRLKDAV